MRSRSRIIGALAAVLACVMAAASAQGFDKDKDKRKRRVVKPPAEKPAPAKAAPVKSEPVTIEPLPEPEPQKPANGSLYTDGASNASLLTDFKARRTGDLVFVDVVESSTANVTSQANRTRDSGTLGGLTSLLAALPIPSASAVSSVAGALGGRKFEGKGSTERTSSVQARVVARVIEVLANGDLRIEARKQVDINKEKEWLTLSGIVRQRDITAQNSVPSTQVGDLRVALNGKGIASADNGPGWLWRLFEKVSPF